MNKLRWPYPSAYAARNFYGYLSIDGRNFLDGFPPRSSTLPKCEAVFVTTSETIRTLLPSCSDLGIRHVLDYRVRLELTKSGFAIRRLGLFGIQ